MNEKLKIRVHPSSFRVQVNPDNSREMSALNIFIIQSEYPAKKWLHFEETMV